jgi:hypothetical protein
VALPPVFVGDRLPLVVPIFLFDIDWSGWLWFALKGIGWWFLASALFLVWYSFLGGANRLFGPHNEDDQF